MIRYIRLYITIGICFALMSSNSFATVITFDAFEAPGFDITRHPNPLDIGDFRFTPTGGVGVVAILTAHQDYPTYNGSAALITDNSADIIMTRIDGGVFGVSSIDVDRLFRPDPFEFVGQLLGGGQIMQQFTADDIRGNQLVMLSGFQNLTSLTLGAAGTRGLANIGSIDNIRISAIPVPSILALFGLGLAGIGYQRR